MRFIIGSGWMDIVIGFVLVISEYVLMGCINFYIDFLLLMCFENWEWLNKLYN